MDSLVYKTLTMAIVFIFLWIIVISGMLFIQLHHCLGLFPTPHGVDGTKVKQIAK
jgi:hypothetical protein